MHAKNAIRGCHPIQKKESYQSLDTPLQDPGSSFQIPHRLDFRNPRGERGGNPRRGFRNENPFSAQGKTLATRDNAFMRGCVNTTTKL